MPTRPRTPRSPLGPYPPGWEPFLGAIRDHLDDDTPRVVFADWLQENGDPDRAEFVRLQCDAARGAEVNAARVKELLAANLKRWLHGLPKTFVTAPERYAFRRGFVSSLTMQGRRWLADGEAIRRFTALEHLKLEQVWTDVFESTALADLRALTLPTIGSAGVEALAESPVIPGLESLDLLPAWGSRVSQRSFRKLLSNPKLTRLRKLSLERMPVGNAVANTLAAAPHVTTLEELSLSDSEIDNDGLVALLNAPTAASLRVLRLVDASISDVGVRQLVRSPARGLAEINLRYCMLTPASARLFAEWEGLRGVRTLDLRNNQLRLPEAKVIAGSPYATNLTELKVI